MALDPGSSANSGAASLPDGVAPASASPSVKARWRSQLRRGEQEKKRSIDDINASGLVDNRSNHGRGGRGYMRHASTLRASRNDKVPPPFHARQQGSRPSYNTAAIASPARRNIRETLSPYNNNNNNNNGDTVDPNMMPTKKSRLEQLGGVGHDRSAADGHQRERWKPNPNMDSPPNTPQASSMLDHLGAEKSTNSRHAAGRNIEAAHGRPHPSGKLGVAARSKGKATTGKHGAPKDQLSTIQGSPNAIDPPEKRTLRSSDVTSASTRSELAAYFPDYEQLLSLEPMKKGQSGRTGVVPWPIAAIVQCSHSLSSYGHLDALSVDTSIVIKDDLQEPITLDKINSGEVPHKPPYLPNQQPEFLNPLLNLCNARIIDLQSSDSPRSEQTQSMNADDEEEQDPLPHEIYFKAHRRLERQEKRLRNIERDRAQHGKIQLDRLLNELYGHDWLRVMGITGVITEAERKLYELKRAFFIREISALVDKFGEWKEEEKRRKAGKEQHASFVGFADLEDGESNQGGCEPRGQLREGTEKSTNKEQGDGKSTTDPTPGSPAADFTQSNQEPKHSEEPAVRSKKPKVKLRFNLRGQDPSSSSLSASSTAAAATAQPPQPSPSRKRAKNIANTPPPPPPPPPPPTEPSRINPHSPQIPPPDETKPFKSFYANRHHRDAALGKIRRGRLRLAFGQPLVHFTADHDFELPQDILTPDAVRAAERRFRRARREMIANSGSGH